MISSLLALFESELPLPSSEPRQVNYADAWKSLAEWKIAFSFCTGMEGGI